MSYLVLSIRIMNLPCQSHGNDGDKTVPEGGVLFLSLPPAKGEDRDVTEFPTAEAAQAAIDRTVAHFRERYPEPWWVTASEFTIVDKKFYQSMGTRRRKKKATSAAEDLAALGLPPGPSPQVTTGGAENYVVSTSVEPSP